MIGFRQNPLGCAQPLLTTVVIVPEALILRTRPPAVSAIKRFPLASRATAAGAIPARVAGPLSPEKVTFPFPATVLMLYVYTEALTACAPGSLMVSADPRPATALC